MSALPAGSKPEPNSPGDPGGAAVAPSLPVSDEELVRRANAGDQDAYKELFNRHYGWVYALARRWLRNDAEAQDAAAEVFESAFKALGGFKGKSQFRTWLYRIVVNRLYQYKKRAEGPESAVRSLESGESTLEDILPGLAQTPEEIRALKQERLAVIAAVYSLSEEDRAACCLRFLLGLSTRETAEILHTSIGAVKMRVSRGRAGLAGLLGLVAHR